MALRSESLRITMDALITAEAWEDLVSFIQGNWTELLAQDPMSAREALEALPDEVLVAHPRASLAKGYLDRIAPGDHAHTMRFRKATPAGPPRGVFDELVQLSIRATARRASGEYDAAEKMASEARELLDAAESSDREQMQQALPEMTYAWGYVRELAGDLDGARREFVDSYDIALMIDDQMGRARAAGALAWVDALAGRNTEARAWLARLPEIGDAWWAGRSIVPAQLAEVMLLIGTFEFDEARRVLAQIDLRPARERWPAHKLLSALLVGSHVDAVTLLAEIDAASADMPDERAERGEGAAFLAIARHRLLSKMGSQSAARLELNGAVVPPASLGAKMIELWKIADDARSGRAERVERAATALTLSPAVSPWVMVAALALKAGAESSLGVPTASRTWESAVALASREHLYSALAVGDGREIPTLMQSSSESLPPEIAAHILRTAGSRVHDPFLSLTPREHVVLAARLRGLTVGETAEAVFVSVNTVKTQLRTVYRKIGVTTFSQLKRAASMHGYIPLPQDDGG
ncbi:DNA-binding CsgD family transcriptional regulator [Microbacterium foliorum]|uniref:helix-turn-helix transcriptional regulator n=1 Tax=Microbacterium foliorum TaxID=104336 RepID=UPI00209FE094|nr:helix-turn-helix transcriptional regulator [Microbacterium foliorum]MCP1428614.1 DNA-binding CsgD family transcriptional regulator [Microbacterium foliorum]